MSHVTAFCNCSSHKHLNCSLSRLLTSSKTSLLIVACCLEIGAISCEKERKVPCKQMPQNQPVGRVARGGKYNFQKEGINIIFWPKYTPGCSSILQPGGPYKGIKKTNSPSPPCRWFFPLYAIPQYLLLMYSFGLYFCYLCIIFTLLTWILHLSPVFSPFSFTVSSFFIFFPFTFFPQKRHQLMNYSPGGGLFFNVFTPDCSWWLMPRIQ